MPILFDMPLVKFEDGILTVALNPPTAIGGWDIEFRVQKRFGQSSGLIIKQAMSGYITGQSGITFVNSGNGTIDINVNQPDTSGLEFGNYAASVRRMNSGSRSVLSQGFLVLYPDVDG